MIETSRLEIRPLKYSDYNTLSELFSDPEVMKYSVNGTKTKNEVKVWVKSAIEGSETSNGIDVFAVVSKENYSLVGYCGLTLFPNLDGSTEIEIGYRLIRNYWGNGFATEAACAVRDYSFIELELPRLVALIEPTNKISIGVAKKIGMSYEKEVMLDGYDYPDHLYSMKNTAMHAKHVS